MSQEKLQLAEQQQMDLICLIVFYQQDQVDMVQHFLMMKDGIYETRALGMTFLQQIKLVNVKLVNLIRVHIYIIQLGMMKYWDSL